MNNVKITFDLAGDKADIKKVRKIVRAFSHAVDFKQSKHFSLVIVSEAQIRKWNRIYRGKDKVTDVLSFAESDFQEDLPLNIVKESSDLGEILICWPQLKRQSKEYGWSEDVEFSRLLVHGLAHLVGYDHEDVTIKEAKRMTNFEGKVFKLLKIEFDESCRN
jgi:probable rRNA maturation factor